jgi:hypothetical protein
MADSVALDPVDLQILRLPQNDARTTYRDLAAATGVAPADGGGWICSGEGCEAARPSPS